MFGYIIWFCDNRTGLVLNDDVDLNPEKEGSRRYFFVFAGVIDLADMDFFPYTLFVL